jgi:hypothetical protein
MNFCTNCGSPTGEEPFCTNCGEKSPIPLVTSASESDKPVFTQPAELAKLQQQTEPSSSGRKKTIYIISGLAIAIFVLLLAIGQSTARHWEKIDIPAHAETYHEETYLTGLYDVVDSGVNPCWIGQDWTDCTNLHVYEYNAACTTLPLTNQARNYCSRYLSMIDDMKARDSWGYYVSSLGSWGILTQIPEEATEQVSNNDFRPAETHEAVCYFGSFGECD